MATRLSSWFVVLAVVAAAAVAIFRARPPVEGAGAPSLEHANDPSQAPGAGDLPPGHPPLEPGSAAHSQEPSDLPPGHPTVQQRAHEPSGHSADHPPMQQGPHGSTGLPSNHPPLAPAGGAHGASQSGEQRAIEWQVPRSWTSAPNASTMRIATYRVPARGGSGETAEMTVVRAGGTTDANIKRWVGQFADAREEKRTERKVRGLKVTTVEIVGTFTGGGPMSMSADPGRHPGWALLGAIVETEGSPYFFKLLGPAATVSAARPEFQALIDSIVPSGSGAPL